MTKLSEAAKHEIVVLLARFTSAADVVVYMREHFGIEIDRFQVRAYDLSSSRYEAGEKWRPIFEAARRAYLETIEAVPIAHKAYRLHQFQRALDRAQQTGNLVLVCDILERAAKEVGGAFTNERKVAVEPSGHSFRDLTSEERRARVADMLREALAPAQPVTQAA